MRNHPRTRRAPLSIRLSVAFSLPLVEGFLYTLWSERAREAANLSTPGDHNSRWTSIILCSFKEDASGNRVKRARGLALPHLPSCTAICSKLFHRWSSAILDTVSLWREEGTSSFITLRKTRIVEKSTSLIGWFQRIWWIYRNYTHIGWEYYLGFDRYSKLVD